MTEQCTRLSSGLCQASLIYQRPKLYIPFIYQTLYTKLIIPNFIYQTIYTKLYIPNFIYQTLYTGTVLGLAIYWFGVEAVVTLYTVDILGDPGEAYQFIEVRVQWTVILVTTGFISTVYTVYSVHCVSHSLVHFPSWSSTTLLPYIYYTGGRNRKEFPLYTTLLTTVLRSRVELRVVLARIKFVTKGSTLHCRISKLIFRYRQCYRVF